jgi:eukaryotic-like serine/threonine-protein kinase
MLDDDLECRILDFERSWEQHVPCQIQHYLESASQSTPEMQHLLLLELICIDLEFRWRNSGVSLIESDRMLLDGYVRQFPELHALDDLPLDLIGQEYRVRYQWGDRPTHDEFLTRFGARQELIRAELHKIDRELADESGESRIRPQSLDGPSVPDLRADPTIARGLLRHHDVLLKKMIGSGLMGKVYEAWQHSQGCPVAVKFLRKAFLGHPHVVQRFIGEATIIGKLDHPNIVKLHGLGRTPANAYFIVMELVSGSDLAAYARSRVISVREALQWTIESCSALEHAHSRGIIHCDLKPANLLVDRDGHVRVTDFGLSRTLFERMPWTGQLEGTAPFMAPEQASGAWGSVDVRTDVYGIGAVLYALLTGRPPWTGRRLPDVLAQVASAAPVVSPKSLRPDLPEAVDRICQKCLSKPAANRYSTVSEVRSELAKQVV